MKRWALVKVKDATLYPNAPFMLATAHGQVTNRYRPQGSHGITFCRITWSAQRWQRSLSDFTWFPENELEEFDSTNHIENKRR